MDWRIFNLKERNNGKSTQGSSITSTKTGLLQGIVHMTPTKTKNVACQYSVNECFTRACFFWAGEPHISRYIHHVVHTDSPICSPPWDRHGPTCNLQTGHRHHRNYLVKSSFQSPSRPILGKHRANTAGLWRTGCVVYSAYYPFISIHLGTKTALRGPSPMNGVYKHPTEPSPFHLIQVQSIPSLCSILLQP